VRIDDRTKRLEIDQSREPMAYPQAASRAAHNARLDSEKYGRREPFKAEGKRVGVQ
jgi:hypothetical protein